MIPKKEGLENYLKATENFIAYEENGTIIAGIPSFFEKRDNKVKFEFGEMFEINKKTKIIKSVYTPFMKEDTPKRLQTASARVLKNQGYLSGHVRANELVEENFGFTYEKFKEKFTDEKYQPIIELLDYLNESSNTSGG